ncbi:MAG TPA: hypothetical protein VIG76_14760 [Amnibacterium sp.]|jgi:hypothetical protein|uniref:hypothetical protein n=1 Tax=Amnibacterium sp. TaxID=1872496 RepID=UPI002F934719
MTANGDLDDLRRRLYTPHATAEDVERYAALAQESAPEGADQPPGPPRPRVPVRLVLGVGAAAAVLAATAVLSAIPHPAPQASTGATPTPTPAPAPGVIAAAADEPVLAVPASARAPFIARLRSGRPARLLPYLWAHPGDVPSAVRTGARGDPEEHFGTGPGMFGVTPAASAQHGGRLVLAVTVDRATTVDLQVVRADSGMQSFIERLDGGAPATPGQPVVRTVVYDGEAPTIVEVTLPKGVHWDVVTALTD